MGKAGRCLAALAMMTAAAPAAAQDFDPASLDLAALVECRADAGSYNSFAFWLAGEADSAARLGWKEVASDNPFLRQYEMSAPLHVFGRETRAIAFTSSGPMAVLDGVSAPDLASQLGIAPTLSTPEKFLGEKVIAEKSAEDGGVTVIMRVSLNVSTVDTLPGKTLAGCSYALDVK